LYTTTSYLEFPKREFPRSGIAGIPIGIPGSKTALFWEFPGIPWDSHTEGVLLHTEGVPLHTEVCFGFVSYQKILKYLCLGSSFAAVVVDDTAIRASPALEERNNNETAREVPLQSPMLPIAEF
jgi:hypothetical protein